MNDTAVIDAAGRPDAWPASGLDLDARQRAMLEEMGVKVWWPSAPRAPEVQAVAAPPAADVRSRPAAAPSPSPAASPAFVAAVSATSPVAPRAAIGGAAAVLVDAPLRLYAGESGADTGARGGWLIVADMPPDADGRHGEPLSGDAGRLLDNMLRALQLHGGALPVHLMRTHRGVASGHERDPQPFSRDAFGARASALAPRVILAMGPLAAQSLLRSTDPLGRLRGRVTPLDAPDGVPVVVTYHPAYLLRNMADKARAWVDLCLAADQATQRSAT